MKQLLLTLAATILLAGGAFAQTPGPGQDRGPAASATQAEKATAKAARIAEGRAVAKAEQPGDDRPATTAKTRIASKADRKAAAAKRKAEGAKVSKAPKDVTGTNR